MRMVPFDAAPKLLSFAFAFSSFPEEVNTMARHYNEHQAPLVKIAYSKVTVNGKTELIPMELYADGSVRRSA